ncbi:MFS transporter [Actinomadura sp. KC06]|uniref:MFS transporter n=1 Tax=Actinomadura sp. KC06 TaxID=2530369 RepID=UPI00104706FA|nr:MFS transporter [Actinomadura sp. KC06]TDD29487.1 MFS transporter [Actinomadura sp. KC06]
MDKQPDGRAPAADPRRWQALALLGVAFFMVILDATIVLTAVPSMQDDLGLTVAGVQWVLTAYALTFAGLMLFFGRMADLLGRRRVFMAGLLLFVASSLACGFAWSAAALVAARAVQGVAAAIMAPTALSIVASSFPDDAERNKALGIWGGLGGFGATAGLLLGGVLTSLLGWEWIFFINVPVGLAVLALCPILLGRGEAASGERRFDVAGAATITAAPLLIAFAVIRAPEVGWGGATVLGSFAAAAALLVLFVVVESRSAAPLVPLRIFRNRALVGGNLLMLAVGLAVDGMLFPLTLYAQQVLGYSAMEFGLMSAVMTVMSVVGAFAGQAFVTRLGVRPIAIGGTLLIVAGSLLLVPVAVDGSFLGDMFWGLLVFGPGMGACFVTAQISALTGVSEEESGLAAGLVDTVFNIGSAIGIAIVTSVAVAVSRTAISETGAPASVATFNDGLRAAFGVAAAFGAIGLLAALFVLERRTPSTADAPKTTTPATPG